MSNMPANINKQFKQLLAEGLTPEQAAQACGIDAEAAHLMIVSEEHKTKPVSIQELIEEFRPEAVRVLIEIARGYGDDVRASDRVKACQILLEGKGVMPDVNAAAASKLMERFSQMRERTGFGAVIDVADSKPPAPSPTLELSFGK